MKSIQIKTVGLTLVAILVAAISIFAYQYDQPGKFPVEHGGKDWEASVNGPDIQREHAFIRSGNVTLEADLLIPAGGTAKKGAVIFVTGSGPVTYQDYFWYKFPQHYVQEVFLPRDMAVLYVNKRGMGASQGNWRHQDFQGSADDVYAAVQFLKHHHAIDPDRIGIIGHSQGGYIVPIAASQHQDVAFFISLAGPTTVVWEQMEDTFEHEYRCQGYAGGELKKEVESAMKWSRLEANLGKVIPLGEARFQAGIIDYDPRRALQTVHSPGLLVFAENDPMVPADHNLARFAEIFNGNPPDNLQTVTITGTHHDFRLTDMCLGSVEEMFSAPFSDELTRVLRDWLTEQGY